MSKRLVRKTISAFNGNWTAPANVRSVTVTVQDNFNLLVGGAQNVVAGLRRNGLVSTSGSGTNGTLGDGTIVDKSSMVAVSGGNSFVQITNSGAAGHFLGLRADGTILAWGSNASGQLGDGTIASKSVPTLVTGSSNFVSVATGFSTSFGIRADGTAWAWGNNGNFQLGNNNSAILNASSPIQVAGVGSYIQISGGENHVLALRNDGSAWSWGQNNNGQLGNNATVAQSSPVQVVGGHSFIQVSAAGAVTTVSYALKANGEAWAWGQNLSGQLGIGTTTPSSTSSPVPVIGGHSFIRIIGMSNGAAALKANGEVWAWGSNVAGQLGDGTATIRSSPVQVIGGHSFVSIAGANQAVIALKANGTAWTWGANFFGQLAQNLSTTINRSSPVQIAGTNVFQTGSLFINKTVLEVVPNTTYNINFFLVAIGSQLFRNYNSRNNINIILEYYV
jgi:alpha-tubulin suppressor-like RCC1 family protein